MKKQLTQEELIKLLETGGNDSSLMLLERISEVEDRIDTLDEKISKDVSDDVKNEPTDEKLLSLIKPLIPKPQEKGKVDKYVITEQDKKSIASYVKVPIVEKVIVEKTEIIREKPTITNEIKEVAITDPSDVIVDKINQSNKVIQRDRVEGLIDIERMAKANAMPVTT